MANATPSTSTAIRKVNVLLLVVASVLFAVSVVLFGVSMARGELMSPSRVSCPEEDSCTVDYRDGVWHIDPTVP